MTTPNPSRMLSLSMDAAIAASARRRNPFSDPHRECWIVPCLQCLLLNPGALTKLAERHVSVRSSDVINIVGQISGNQDAWIQRQRRMDGSGHLEHQRGAVGRQRIIEARVQGDV